MREPAVLGTTDAMARDALVTGLLVDVPDLAVVVYEHRFVTEGGDPSTMIMRRRVLTTDGTCYDDKIGAGYDCAGCCLRDGLVETVAGLETVGRWSRLLVVPPLSAPLAPTARQLGETVAEGAIGSRLTFVIAAVDASSDLHDVLGVDLLDERAVALSDHDRRSVGEAVCEQVEYAALAVGAGDGTPSVRRWSSSWSVPAGPGTGPVRPAR